MRTLTDRPRSWRALLAGLALVAVLLPDGGAAHAAHAAPPARPATGTPTSAAGPTVTLVTGDQVTLGPERDGRPTVAFRSRHGQPDADGFRVLRRDDGVYVIPDDVARLVPGTLDPALFDVTALAAMGYDDAHRGDVPLIVKRASGVRTLSAAGVRTRRPLTSIGADAATVAKTDAPAFGDELAGLQDARRGARAAASPLDGVRKIWLDGRMSAADLDGYLTQVNAPSAWASKLTGSGVPVAVLDTGVDDGHPDLAGQVTAAANFTDAASAADGNGHGTHVASLIAGTGAKADGARRGIAYGAHLISGKVLGDDGFGQDSWVIAGMQWAVAQGAKVVSMSLGGTAGDTDDPVVQALDELTASSGTLFVVAAGNGGDIGREPFTIESPGTAASALTVGAVSADDRLAAFSSEGPTTGSYRLKPDVTAPGVDILGARAGARDGDFYRSLSGTSQATPLVAGTAALLLQEHPTWTWQRVKATIVDTAYRSQFYTMPWKFGGGRLDLGRATTETVTSSTASLDFGYLRFPDRKATQHRDVTLTNDGASPVTVTLAEEETREDGQPAAADGVTVSPSTLTIPAGGSATTTVTLDPAKLADGTYQGTLTVSAGDEPELRLPIGCYDEPEMYDLSVQVLDRDGDPYARGSVWFVNGDTGDSSFDVPLDGSGRTTLRVPPGHYGVFSTITTPAAGDRPATTTLGGTAGIRVDNDVSSVVDARKAVQVRPPSVAGQPTSVTEFKLGYERTDGSGRGAGDYPAVDLSDVLAGRVYVLPSEPVGTGTFDASMRWRLEPTGRVRPGTPAAYELLLTKPVLGPALWPRLTHHDVVRMARLDETVPAVSSPGTYSYGQIYLLMGRSYQYWRPLAAPAHRTVLLTASPDASWSQCLAFPAVSVGRVCDRMRTYRPGEHRAVTWATGLHPTVLDASRTRTTLAATTGIADLEHSGPLDFDKLSGVRLALYRNGDPVGERADTVGYFAIPDGPADFRLEQSYTIAPDALPVARQVSSTWTFHSDPPANPTQSVSSRPALLDVGYAPAVDPLGRARAGHPLALTLTVRHLANATPPVPSVRSARLSYSVDGGASWHPLFLVRTGRADWRTFVPGAALRPGTSVSLRAHATDAAGGTVDQTVLDMTPVA